MSKLYVRDITKTDDGKALSIEVRNEDNNLRIFAKWDGCCDIHFYSNGMAPDDEVTEQNIDNIDYIHICEMNEFIDELQQLVHLAKENLDKVDFNSYWERSESK